VFDAYKEIIEWAMRQTQFTEPAKAEFASVADSWLIACAKAHDYIIVTHEVYDANIKRKIPIPNVCHAFGINYINTFEMLRRLNIRLG
jgi:DNA polymerase III epsilon subunit-like protein